MVDPHPSLLEIDLMTGMRLSRKVMLLINFPLFFLFSSYISAQGNFAGEQELEWARKSVVKISITFFEYSYKTPWQQPRLHGAGGTGFIIEGNRILTNAHVISLANTIRVQRPEQRRDYEAKVLFVAHDSDLAMLTVDDPEFFKDSLPMEIGRTPELNTSVTVMGFPIGGDRLSITRGIVSRKDIDAYSHSGIDYHLTVQVDAAINPGNSGGPALQDGKVIGIAFQAYTRGENLGYLIPPPVIDRFLNDVKDGKYDGYIEFGSIDQNTVNGIMKKALSLSGEDSGVMVNRIVPGSSADGYLRPGDIILSMDGHRITETGDVELDGHLVSYTEIVDNMSNGATTEVEILRNGKRENIKIPLKGTDVIAFQRKNYDGPPDYYTVGGLVFQPLNADLMSAYSGTWSELGRSEIFYRYNFFLRSEIYRETSGDVVLTRRLNDPINLYLDPFLHRIVESVNGEKVKSFQDFIHSVDSVVAKEKYLVIQFHDSLVPLVMRSRDVIGATPHITRRYGLPADRHVVMRGKR